MQSLTEEDVAITCQAFSDLLPSLREGFFSFFQLQTHMHTCPRMPDTQAHTHTGLGGCNSKSSFVVSSVLFLLRELPGCAGYRIHLWASSPSASCGPSPEAPVLPRMSHPSASTTSQPQGFSTRGSLLPTAKCM